MNEAERVAAGLSPRLADAIRAAEQDGDHFFVRWWHGDHLTFHDARKMHKLGLGFPVWSGFCLGEFGQSVATILKEQEREG